MIKKNTIITHTVNGIQLISDSSISNEIRLTKEVNENLAKNKAFVKKMLSTLCDELSLPLDSKDREGVMEAKVNITIDPNAISDDLSHKIGVILSAQHLSEKPNPFNQNKELYKVMKAIEVLKETMDAELVEEGGDE